MRHSNAVDDDDEEPQRDSARNSNSTRKISILRIRERAFLRWKENLMAAKQEMISVEIEARVWMRAVPERSTGARKASSDGDFLRRSDENTAAVAIESDDRDLCVIYGKKRI